MTNTRDDNNTLYEHTEPLMGHVWSNDPSPSYDQCLEPPMTHSWSVHVPFMIGNYG